MMNSSNGENNDAPKIKSFQYLDTEKMYSISSQIFEGLTDHVINSSNKVSREADQQKGVFFSGRILADIIEESSGTSEKKFLHDYSYNLFEKKLIDTGRVLEINEGNVLESSVYIEDKSFVKVTGKILFNDSRSIINSLKNFNELGYALWYITTGKNIVPEHQKLKDSISKIPDRNQKAKATARLDNMVNFKELLEAENLYLEPEMIKSLAYTLEYGFGDQLEVQMPLISKYELQYMFSCILKRNMLKESEDFLIRKYSRATEKKFTIFGIPTQILGEDERLNPIWSDEDNENFKHAINRLVSKFISLEDTYNAKLENEFVIDPIAIYIEI